MYDTLQRLRAAPHDSKARAQLLEEAYPHVRRAARRFPDAEDVAQAALVRVARRWPSCHATNEPQAVGWARSVTSNLGKDRVRRRRPTPLEEVDLAAPAQLRDPQAEVLVAALHAAVARARAPWSLPPDLRARARRLGVSPKVALRACQVSAMWLLRAESHSGDEVAQALGLRSRAAVYKAAERGAGAVAIAAGLLARDEPDVWRRLALREIEGRAG